MKTKRLLAALTMTALIGTTFSGCAKKEETKTGGGDGNNYNELALNVNDISELPDWNGKEIDLVYWFCQGTSAPTIGKYATDRTIRNELKRVTGIAFDEEYSFDNNSESGDAKISKIMATDTWPDIGYNIEESLVKKLIKADKVWDVTELIPKYMPTYTKIREYNERSKKQFESKELDGKEYNVWKPASYGVATVLDPDYSVEKYSKVLSPSDSRSWIYVRDDILKKIYPNAKTRAEMEDIYVKNGSFTKEEMTDVTITSIDEFYDFLKKINDLGVTENGRKVYPFYTHNGTDNWDILSVLTPAMNGAIANDFAYFDREDGKLVRTVDKDWFKESMRTWVKLINEDIASREAIVDNKAAFEQKKNNGEYAVLYGSATPPTSEALKAAGKNYSYRKVLIDIPTNFDKYIKKNPDVNYIAEERFTLFKSKNLKTEEDVAQVLRFIDFLITPVGSKAAFWGPKNGGLYTEENGIMKYADADLEKDMVYNGSGEKKIYYGITSFPDLYNFSSTGSMYNPVTVYNREGERKASQYASALKYSFIEPNPNLPDLKTDFNIWEWTTYIDSLNKFWNARKSSEDAFTVVFTAKNDQEFEQYYQELKDTLTRNNLDDKTMEEWNKVYKEENKEYWDDYINWRP